MTDYADIPDDQIKAWIAFASMRKDRQHVARLRLVLAARAAVELTPRNFVFANLDGTIYQTGPDFTVQFADGGATVKCHSLDVAILALQAEMREG